MYEDTIILFSADNGLAVGQHGLLGKQSVYEHSIRVPFVIAGPGIPVNETRNGYIYLMDVFPTLCDYNGLSIPESVEGISFKKAIENPGICTRQMLYAGYADKVQSIKITNINLLNTNVLILKKLSCSKLMKIRGK